MTVYGMLIMNTLMIFLNFIGFFMLLNASEKAVLQQRFFESKVQGNRKMSKIIGLLIHITTFFMATWFFGITAGILIGFCMIMLVGSLLLLFNPLQKMNYKQVLYVFAALLFVEFIIY